MQSIEITGKTLDEASEAAAQKLGVPVEQLTVKVLEQGKGLFGKGNVRILAEVAEGAEGAQDAGDSEPVEASEVAAVEAPAPKPKSRSRRTKTAEEEPKPAEEPEAPAPNGEATEEAAVEIIATKKDGEDALKAVNEILKTTNIEVVAKVASLNARYVNIELDGTGKELGYLVGKNGEVLNALQYLMNIVVGHRLQNGVRVTLDANNYRERREAALTRYAEEIASEVKKRKEEAVLDPLPAFERRIIHKALAAIEGVSTYSEGEEPNRRVVIAPAE